jgi:hypothetical protein
VGRSEDLVDHNITLTLTFDLVQLGGSRHSERT